MPSVSERPEAPTAIQTHLAASFVSLELSRSIWLITSLSPASGERIIEAFRASRGRRGAAGALFGAQAEGVGADRKILSDRRHSGSGCRRLLASSGAAKRRRRKPCRRSVVDRDVAPTAARQDRQDLPVLRALSLCTCCRHYPGAAAGRRHRSSHPAVSAFPDNVVGSACTSSFSRFARRSLALRPAHSRRHLYVTCYTEGFSHFVTSMTAPVASGWSIRRVGLAPTGKRRLVHGAHVKRTLRIGAVDVEVGGKPQFKCDFRLYDLHCPSP